MRNENISMVKGTSLLSSEKKLRAGGWARVGERGRTWGQSDIRLLYLYNINKIYTHTHTQPTHPRTCVYVRVYVHAIHRYTAKK